MNLPDILLIVTIVVVLVVVLLYQLNKKSMRRMIQAQDFIDQNRMTVQIFVIDKKQERPSPSNMPKAVFAQMPAAVKRKKANLIRAKAGSKIVTFICDKPVYEVLPVKKNVKVVVAGMYIVSVVGMNLADKKKKSISEKVSAKLSQTMSDNSSNGKK